MKNITISQKNSTENYTKVVNPEIPVSNALVGGEFFRANDIQHQGAIGRHTSIDQSQIQHSQTNESTH